MEIKGKVHCFFEQSGVFKNEFIKLGIPAEDYDIQNNFGQTDHTDDLFKAIESAYENRGGILDTIKKDDLIVAFFPCIYFCENNEMFFTGKHRNLKNKGADFIENAIIDRAEKRQHLYVLLLKLFNVCTKRELRLIVENPYSPQHYLCNNFPYTPKVIDKDRTMRGDYYTKPTQYWFHNCEPTRGLSLTSQLIKKSIAHTKPGIKAGICGEDRSLISPDYARNWICDFVLGQEQANTIPTLF